MKFAATAKALADALAPVARLAPAKSPIPILSHMRLEVADGRLLASAFDLDREAQASVPIGDAVDGVTTVSAARLSEILRNLPKDARVSVEADEFFARVASGRSHFKLPILPALDFPSMSVEAFDCSAEMPAPELRLAFGATAPAAAASEDRYYLRGVYLHADAGKLAAVATDGNQLVRFGLDCEAPAGFVGVIIPSATIKEFLRLCDAAGGAKVRLDLARARIRLSAGDFALTSKVVDGTFPDYHRIIPQGAGATVRLDRASALSALRRVAMVVSADEPAILLQSGDGALTLRGRGEVGAEAFDEVAAEIEGELRVAFNHKYLLCALDALGGEMIVFEPGGGRDPAKFRDPARGDRALAIVMPLGWRD